MKLITAVCVAAVCAVGLSAQQSETTTKTKITIKDGKSVKVTGCVEARGSQYVLTDVADKDGAMHSYLLVTDDTDLSKHVGHRVMIEGKAADRGDGKVETETKTKTKVEHGDDKETHDKSEISGDLTHMPYLGVKSLKMIAASCP